MGVFRFQQLLAFSSKMADVGATSTDKRSVTLLTTYNARSVHAVTHRAQQNLRDFTAIRPCFHTEKTVYAINCIRGFSFMIYTESDT